MRAPAWSHPAKCSTLFTPSGTCQLVRPAAGTNLLVVHAERSLTHQSVAGDQENRSKIPSALTPARFASGFTEELVDPEGGEVLSAGSTAFLIAPADATNFRLNIGVRTFFSGASLRIFVRTPTGSLVRTVEKTFDPTFFVQQSADIFLGGPISSSDIIDIRVDQGSAVVYGATSDNTTNDPSIQFARVISAP